MTNHTLHPDTYKYGLADGCPRCSEYSTEPLRLDHINLNNLIIRLINSFSPRSENEARAIEYLEAILDSYLLSDNDWLVKTLMERVPESVQAYRDHRNLFG